MSSTQDMLSREDSDWEVVPESSVRQSKGKSNMTTWDEYIALCQGWSNATPGEEKEQAQRSLQDFVKDNFSASCTELGTHTQLFKLMATAPTIDSAKVESTDDVFHQLGRETCKTLLLQALRAVNSKQAEFDDERDESADSVAETEDMRDMALQAFHAANFDRIYSAVAPLVAEAQTYSNAVPEVLGGAFIELDSNCARDMLSYLSDLSDPPTLWDKAQLSGAQQTEREELERKKLEDKVNFSVEDQRKLECLTLRQNIAEAIQ